MFIQQTALEDRDSASSWQLSIQNCLLSKIVKIMSFLWGKNWTDLLVVPSKILGFLSLSFSGFCVNALYVQHPPEPSSPSTLWYMRGKENQHSHNAQIACCAMSNKVLYFWSRKLMTSANIHTTMAGQLGVWKQGRISDPLQLLTMSKIQFCYCGDGF